MVKLPGADEIVAFSPFDSVFLISLDNIYLHVHFILQAILVLRPKDGFWFRKFVEDAVRYLIGDARALALRRTR